MDRNRAKEFYPILQAFIDGKEIEVYSPNRDTWIGIRNNDEIYLGNKYRIKPEPKYRPFANAEECWQEMLRHEPFGWIKGKEGWQHSLITSIVADEEDVYINGINGFVLDEIMEHYTFADGLPFGVKEEE